MDSVEMRVYFEPCPFCGSSELRYTEYPYGYYDTFVIRCRCGASLKRGSLIELATLWNNYYLLAKEHGYVK